MTEEKGKHNSNEINEVELNDLVNLYDLEEKEGIEEVEEIELESLYKSEEQQWVVEETEPQQEVLKEEAEPKQEVISKKKGLKDKFFSRKSKKEKEIEEKEVDVEDNNKSEEVSQLLALMETDSEELDEIIPQETETLDNKESEEGWDIGVHATSPRGVKIDEEYTETDDEKRIRIKRKRIFLSSGIFSTLVCIYLIIHIIVWWNNNHYNTNTIGFIKDTEVVGVSVDPTAGLSIDAKEVDIQLAKTYPFIDVDFQRLKERNLDTVAWLKVGAVNLDIPIVQTTDNDYYLTHDFDGNVNSLGWVFADARSNMESVGFNTVLYGHNAATRTMFGSLKGLLEITDPEMRKAKETIQLNTVHTKGVYEIVSVYVTTYDDWAYVQQSFDGTEEKQKFIDNMRKRNTVKLFDRENITTSDQFLTFSTCHGPAGTDKRLVVVARLIAEK